MCAGGYKATTQGKKANPRSSGRLVDSFLGQVSSPCGYVIFLLAFAGISIPAQTTGTASSDSARQDWVIRTWEIEDGLPENSATAMVQDSDGYLWFGTFKGLVRFDGVVFTVFNHSNTPGLPADGIVNLHLDRTGRLWASTLSGLAVRQPSGWHLVRKPETPNDFIRTFTERANGELLLTTFDGKVLEYSKDRLIQLPSPPGQRGGGYLGAVDEDGGWWVAQDKFIGRWNGRTWQPMVPAMDLSAQTPTTIGIAPALKGGIWLLLGSQLLKYSHGTEVSRRSLPELPGNIWSMTEDSRSNIWVCTIQRGVCQVLPDGKMLRWNEENGISYHGTRFVFEDREHNLWIGTSGGGLQRFKERRFRSFGPEAGLTERVVKSIAPASDGGVWIGTYGNGLFRWTQEGITNVPLSDWTNKHLYVQAVVSQSNSSVWIGTYGAGLFMLDGNGSHRFPADQVGGDNGLALFEDSRGRIWTSGGQGISMFEGEAFQGYKPLVNGVCCFAEDSDKIVWFSNQEGVYRVENDSFREVKDNSIGRLGGVVCMRAQPHGVMWLGTIGGGLLRWKNGAVSRIDVDDGLASPNIHGIVDDQRGYFWMSSNRGVMRVAQAELEAVADGARKKVVSQLLDLNDGLPSVECPNGQQPTCCRDAEGRLWFATLKGAAMMDPAIFRANRIAPLARIEDIVYNLHPRGTAGSERVTGRLQPPFRDNVELPAACRGIEIHYTAPSFASPQKVRFQTLLDAEDLGWSEVDNRRVAYFDELRPGRHVFRVRAANDDGVWNESSATLAFTVLPFFWQTGWFRGLGLVAICGAALAWVYRLKTSLDRRHAAQENITRQLILSQENERHRVASELHDGLGQNLLLMKNRLRMLAEKVTPEISKPLLEISAFTSQAIAEVRSISHALRPSALEQVGLTKAIEWMVDQIAQTSTAKYSSELENIDGVLKPDMEINLYRIAQEALNNVIKHSQATEVIVQVGREPEAVVVSVYDNGRGFEMKSTHRNGNIHTGIGLYNMAERAKVLGGRLEIRSNAGSGTRLTLHVPIQEGSA